MVSISSSKIYISKKEKCLNVILVFNKAICEGHMYIIILGKDSNLVASGSFYGNYTLGYQEIKKLSLSKMMFQGYLGSILIFFFCLLL
jgi:hypothetical protein